MIGLVLACAQRGGDFSLQRQRTVSGSGRVITLKEGDSLQAALKSAQPGDTIALEAGAVFVGPIELPNKGTSGKYITIQSSRLTALPGTDQRVAPKDAGNMPKVVSPGKEQPAIFTAPGASYYKLVGLEIRPADERAQVDTLVLLGDGSSAQDSLAKVPHHLIVDRCYIHAFPNQALKRGIGLHGSDTTISNSYVSDFKLIGQDSQAIAGWNGSGPFKIINNYLEAAGENIVFGGAMPSIPGLIPSDIEIRRNYLSKPLSWRQRDRSYGGSPWSVKNLFELKSARRVQVTGNVMENQWSDVNSGYGAVNLTVRGDSGSQATIENVEFSSNVVRHAGLALNILGKDTVSASQQGRDLRIRNNLFEDINSDRWNDSGGFLKISQMDDVIVDHNTVLHDGLIILVYGSSGNKGFVFTNNIVSNNAYGVVGQGTGSISGALSMFFPGAVIRRNVVVGGDASQYPPGNYYPKGLGEVGFSNPGGAEYQLSAGSAYRGRAIDGKDIGCDLTAVMTAARVAMAGVGN